MGENQLTLRFPMDFPAYWLLVGCGKASSDIDHGRGQMGFKGEATGAADHRHTVRAPFGRWAGRSSPAGHLSNTVQLLLYTSCFSFLYLQHNLNLALKASVYGT